MLMDRQYMAEENQPQQLRFIVDGIEFKAQAWGNPKDFPMLALHGWLDNSASFFALAPKLNDVYLVALDMAGHGQSAHRHGSAPYNIWEDVAEIFDIADQLGWDRFALLGHSRGAIIATLAAGTFPERISHVALIEGILPEIMRAEDTPEQLAFSIKSLKKQSTKPLSVYVDMNAAILARENGMFPLGPLAAKALTDRGVVAVENGFCWSTDKRLLAPSAIKLLPDQMAAFIRRITAPIHLILAEDGMPKLFPPYLSAVQQFPQISLDLIAGGHHLHMEQEVDCVADIFNSFLANR